LTLNLSRHLALAAFAVALFVQPAFAHAHYTESHRGFYRHDHPREMAALRHQRGAAPRARVARLHWRYGLQAFASASSAVPFGPQHSQYADNYSAPAQSWQPTAGWRGGWNNESYADSGFGGQSQLQGMAEQQASANGVPVSLVDRVIKRESGGNPRAVSRGNYGLMQIRLGTARAMGYGGSAAGLLDATTNMTYAVRYLAGAYRAAGGNESRAVALYARGYNTAPRVQEASYYGPSPEGGAIGQSPGFDEWSGGYAPASYRQRLRRRAVF
jgi:soluble lytic murein transglycosylase-like protein